MQRIFMLRLFWTTLCLQYITFCTFILSSQLFIHLIIYHPLNELTNTTSNLGHKKKKSMKRRKKFLGLVNRKLISLAPKKFPCQKRTVLLLWALHHPYPKMIIQNHHQSSFQERHNDLALKKESQERKADTSMHKTLLLLTMCSSI